MSGSVPFLLPVTVIHYFMRTWATSQLEASRQHAWETPGNVAVTSVNVHTKGPIPWVTRHHSRSFSFSCYGGSDASRESCLIRRGLKAHEGPKPSPGQLSQFQVMAEMLLEWQRKALQPSAPPSKQPNTNSCQNTLCQNPRNWWKHCNNLRGTRWKENRWILLKAVSFAAF